MSLMKQLAKYFRQTISALAIAPSLMHLTARRAQAQTLEWSGVCVGSTENSEGVATIQGLECLIANVFVVAITVIGLAAFVMFIVASFRWLMSGGNSKGIESARNTMTFAVVGIVVSLSAFIILQLISSFTGIQSVNQFIIPTSD